MIYDFHAHTCLSDGELSPVELIRRALVSDYRAIALADHCGPGELPSLIEKTVADCALARAHWNILAIPGVELTHLPPQAIALTARRAKEIGAWLVVVHGETITEPVAPGTNLAALESPHVDILAHPGLLTLEEAQEAAARGIFLEISARHGHSLTNGHVAKLALQAGAKLLLNSDAHAKSDLLTASWARNISRGAGLDKGKIREMLLLNPRALLRRIASAHRL